MLLLSLAHAQPAMDTLLAVRACRDGTSIDPCDVDLLQTALEHTDPDVVRVGITWLRRAPDLMPPEASASRVSAATHHDDPRVRRAALASLRVLADRGDMSTDAAWKLAVEAMARDSPERRVALRVLGGLPVPAGEEETLAGLLDVALGTEREATWRLWLQWRHHVPADPAKIDRLLATTVGFSAPLLDFWASHQRPALIDGLSRWASTAPAPRRAFLFEHWATAAEPDLAGALGYGPYAP